MRNLFRQFLDLIPDPALQVGTVTARSGELVTVTLPGGGTLKARGADASAVLGQTVFVRNGVIEGPAPDLPVEVIEV
jgi:hypothetical protein